MIPLLRLLVMTLLLGTLVFLPAAPAHAFYSKMFFSVEEFGKREVITFEVPPGADPPRLSLLNATTLRVTVPGLLAIPLPEVDFATTRFITGWQVEEIPGSEMGLVFTINLKESYLNFRDSVKNGQFRLEIERYPVPMAMGPTRLLEGRVMAGRDATLVFISFTGHGWVEKHVDYGARVVRLRWEDASVDQAWQPVVAEGLAENVNFYSFSRNQVEMEIGIHKEVQEVFFYRNSESGTMIIELRQKGTIGRKEEVERILIARRQAAKDGQPQPLNRVLPVFTNSPIKKILNKTEVDELYFFEKAREAEKDHNYGKSLAYLESLLKTFPETQNGELIDLYKVDLGSKMGRSPGATLQELEPALARQPNNARYPYFRFMQLQLFNRTGLFENAVSIMFDPNLPKNSPEVLLERGRAYIGLRRWDDARRQIENVFELDKKNGEESAEAYFLLAKLAVERGDHGQAVERLNALSRDHINLLSNNPERLMGIADIYFNNRFYDKSINYYGMFLNYYPKDPQWAPWAILRAAESRRRLGQIEGANHLYEQLLGEYPNTEAAIWSRIYKLQIETGRTYEERMSDLKKIVDSAPNTDMVVEAYITQAILQGDAGHNSEALDTLNKLITLTMRVDPVSRALHLKHFYMVEGMVDSLEKQKPEETVMLAEQFGADWRKYPGFIDARVRLAEALLRIGLPHRALPLLQDLEVEPAPELAILARGFIDGSVLGVAAQTMPEGISHEGARVRLDEAKRLAERGEWENILILLERVKPELLVDAERTERLRLLAKAEEGRGRFPQAVSNLEKLLFGKPLGEGLDYFWYASLLQLWKGDEKSLPAFERVAKEATNSEVKTLALMRIGDVLQRQGNLNEAQNRYQEAGKLFPNSSWSKLSKEVALQLEMVK